MSLSDDSLQEALQRAINPTVPEGLARRISVSVVTACPDEIWAEPTETARTSRRALTLGGPAAAACLLAALFTGSLFSSDGIAPSSVHEGRMAAVASESVVDVASSLRHQPAATSFASLHESSDTKAAEMPPLMVAESSGSTENDVQSAVSRSDVNIAAADASDKDVKRAEQPRTIRIAARDLNTNGFKLEGVDEVPAKPEIYGPVLSEEEEKSFVGGSSPSARGYGLVGSFAGPSGR